MRYKLRSGHGELEIRWSIINSQWPTIIFLHGSLGSIEQWGDFPKVIAKETSCNHLVYDRLGYGQSSRYIELPSRGKNYLEAEANVVIEIITELKIQKPILFGHSDGGSVALIVAGKKTKLIKGLITEGAHTFVEEITLKGIMDFKERYIKTDLRKKLAKYHGNKVDEVFNAWTKVWLHPNFKDWNIERFLTKITCPALIIQGEQDEFGSLDQVISIIDQISGYKERLIIKNVGHSPHKEDASFTKKSAVSFINKVVQEDHALKLE